MEGIGQGHSIMVGWIKGLFSLAFCSKCARWRGVKGRGLLGPCPPSQAQSSRLKRLAKGWHPASGIEFDKITAWRGQWAGGGSGINADSAGPAAWAPVIGHAVDGVTADPRDGYNLNWGFEEGEGASQDMCRLEVAEEDWNQPDQQWWESGGRWT